MINVLLASSDDQFAATLTAAIGPHYVRIPDREEPSGQALLDALPPGWAPNIVLLDGAGNDGAALSLAEDLVNRHRIVTILVTNRADELALPALRAGVRDLVTSDVPAHELSGALERAANSLMVAPGDARGAAQAGVEGQVVAVVSPKGGVGKTTVSSNLAVGLAARAPGQVVLVDFDIHFGDCATALNVSAEHTLPDIARGPASHDSMALKSYLTPHASGLYLIPGSDDPAAADAVTPEDVTRLLRLLKSQFLYVVVDTAPGLSEHTLAVMDETDRLVMVTSLDVPGVRGLRKEIDTLNDLNIVTGPQHVVLNFNDPSRGLSVADVEATIRTKVDVVLPQSSAVPLSVNQGIPLLQTGGKDAFTNRLRTLVDLVAPPEHAHRRGFFARKSR